MNSLRIVMFSEKLLGIMVELLDGLVFGVDENEAHFSLYRGMLGTGFG